MRALAVRLAQAIPLAVWALAALGLPASGAQTLQPVPAPAAHVVDTTATLDAVQRQRLEAKLAGFERRSGPQIAVLIVPTTQPEDIAAYAYRVADTWKIGRREVGDGLLVVVAKNDRKIRIEVARALEGAVPDLAARQIMDTAMRPRFRSGDYAGGIEAGLDSLIARIEGEHLPAPAASTAVQAGHRVTHGISPGMFVLFVLALLLGRLFVRLFGPPRSSRMSGRGVGGVGGLGGLGPAAVVWGASQLGRGWGGGGSNRDSGGGFSSGGGGSFGGGGASGDW